MIDNENGFTIARYDAISINYTGSWYWAPDYIKECDDGEMVKVEDIESVLYDIDRFLFVGEVQRAYRLLDKLRDELNK